MACVFTATPYEICNSHGTVFHQTSPIMGNTSTSLRKKALHAFREVLAEKLRENRLYGQLALRDALQLKIWKLFGGECLVDFAEDTDEHILSVVIEGLNFIGVRCRDGDVQLIFVELCPLCGYKMTSWPITSLVVLGRELSQLQIGSTLSNHACSSRSSFSV